MTIKIKLGDGWFVGSDAYNYILTEDMGHKEVQRSFHRSIEDCIQAFIQRKIKNFDSESMSELVRDQKNFLDNLSKILETLNLEIIPKSESQNNIIMEVGK